jgi:hypothetical protein
LNFEFLTTLSHNLIRLLRRSGALGLAFLGHPVSRRSPNAKIREPTTVFLSDLLRHRKMIRQVVRVAWVFGPLHSDEPTKHLFDGILRSVIRVANYSELP